MDGMAKRFLNDTEKKLIALIKAVMQHYKPRRGFLRALLNVLRTIGPGKPRETAHDLSVLVTQDLLIEVIGAYGTQAIGPSFLNVMALVDEEVLKHYDLPNRSPMFADMLRYAQQQIRNGNLLENRWDVETFTSFVGNYLRGRQERITAENLRQALEILYAPSSYRVLSTSWFLMRLLASGYVRHAVEVIDSDELGPTSPVSSRERTALDSLLGNYDEEALSEMLDTEKGVMMSLYGTVLLSTYVNELREEVAQEFAESNGILASVLSYCSALLTPLGTVSIVAYCASMMSSIIQQMTTSSDNEKYCKLLNYTQQLNSSSDPLASHLVSVFCNQRFDADNATLDQIFNRAESLTATNMSAMPASLAVLTTMYLALPIIAFGGYAAQWVSRRMASRGRGGISTLLLGFLCSRVRCVLSSG
ncbi:hypothetical protein APHMUC_0569 [Anaplasma phagocytophilum str. ApMUC09]|uniref:Uncharacterized protein n=1 Tax=Anaplasma phagocytophilum str. ApMUC09 TaxID=1359152 RepID=A0A0F3NAS9_ANAPH|nr:hypothetical protein APHMUC_0569 [Anaplasma phagocytophilum str. ApMUC09]